MLLSHPLFTEHRGKADFWCALENSVEVRGVLPATPSEAKPSEAGPVAERRSGHGRRGAEAYPGVEPIVIVVKDSATMSEAEQIQVARD
jgi:hypothetical protein